MEKVDKGNCVFKDRCPKKYVTSIYFPSMGKRSIKAGKSTNLNLNILRREHLASITAKVEEQTEIRTAIS